MADQPNGTPTAAPQAPAPAAQPSTPSPISDDTLVQVVVDRQPRQEPLSKLRASYQTQTAAENRLQEANRILQDHKADLDLGRRIKARFATDPEGAILEMKQFAEQQLGRPIRLPGAPAQEDGDSGLPSGTDAASRLATSRLEAQIRQMQDELKNLRTTHQVDATEREIEHALDQYPIWRNTNSPEGKAARELAKLTLSGLRAAQPDVAVADHASEIHTRMLGLVSSQVTQVRDQRQQRAEEMPTVPTQGGTPQLTTPQPNGWGTREALRDGTWTNRMREYLAHLNRPR